MNEPNLYALFNLSPNATDDEIKTSFRKHSLIAHPDRQKHEHQEKAYNLFSLLKEARDILLNPQTRNAYDSHGFLYVQKLMNRSIQNPNEKSTKEENFFSKNLQKNKSFTFSQNSRVLSKNFFHFATDLNTFNLTKNSSLLGSAKIHESFISHHFLKELSPYNHLEFGVIISGSKYQQPQSNLDIALNRYLTNLKKPSVIGLGFSLKNSHPIFDVFFKSKLSPSITTSLSIVAPDPIRKIKNNKAIGINLLSGLTNASFGLQKRFMGYWTLSLNLAIPYLAPVISLNRQTPTSNIHGSFNLISQALRLGGSKIIDPKTSILVDSSFRNIFLWKSLKMYGVPKSEIFTHYSTHSFGFHHQISNDMSLSSSLVLESAQIHSSFQLSTLEQDFHFPVSLSPKINLKTFSKYVLIPSSIIGLTYYFLLKPFLREKEKKKIIKQRQEFAIEINFQKEKANQEREEILEEFSEKLKLEKEKNGLIIIEAKYGNYNFSEISGDFPSIIDVTLPIQFYVRNSSLFLGSFSKSNLIGIYDPCPLERKQLKIKYSLNGKEYLIVKNDFEEIEIPKKKKV